MGEKRRGLGRGIGALFPNDQSETKKRPIDIFFSAQNKETTEQSDAAQTNSSQEDNVSRETSATKVHSTVVKGSPTKKTKVLAQPDKRNSQETKLNGATSRKVGSSAKQTKKTDDNTNITDELTQQSALKPVPGATFGEIDVNAIMPNMQQPRTIFDEDDLAELAASIREVGVLQPIIIRRLSAPLPDHPGVQYELIMGERRWRASQLAGNKTVPAIIRHTENSDMLRDALLENLHRAQLNALEEAAAYQQLMEDFNCTQEELSRRIARSRPQISNTLRLLKLPPLVQRRVAAGVLSAGHARALLGLADPAAMERLAQRIVAENLSVRAVEELVALGEDGKPEGSERRSRAKLYQLELNELASRLMDRFDTRVKVAMGQKKGRIAIEFGSIEDLNRILELISEQGVDVSRETSR